MLRKRCIYLFVVLLLVTTCSKKSTEPGNTVPKDTWPFAPPSSEPLDAFAMNATIGRGLNMGNCLETAAEGQGGFVIEDDHLRAIAAAGFNSIRLPITWSTRTQTSPPYTIDPQFFLRVDHIVQTALSLGLVVVMNDHHFDELNEDPATHRQWLLKIWEQVSARYQNYPDELFFEILNEPHGAFNSSAALWNQLAKEVLAIIRQTNPYRMVVIGPISWNAVDHIPTLDLPEDDRGLIVTFHYYWPFQFTHQGASWAGEEANSWLGTIWLGSPAERKAVADDFDRAVSWAQQHDRPLYLGEFGAYEKADDNSRYRWTDHIAR
ncbi:glycoside hydrolase family 5 protein, partial [candidate division KSB1 bacterium]|nr:glycoside hydrolase family 5 protein [candidate division KSB1 bacterium]